MPAYAPDLFYGSGDSDVRQRISFSGGWDLPFDRAWATGPKRLTKGWSLYPIVTWRTGFPFDISAGLAQTPLIQQTSEPRAPEIPLFPAPPSSRPSARSIPES